MTKSNDAFADELIELIGRHYPKALQGDPAHCGICTCKLAECLGGILAFAYWCGDGERSAMAATQVVLDRVVDSLMETVSKAAQMKRDKVH